MNNNKSHKMSNGIFESPSCDTYDIFCTSFYEIFREICPNVLIRNEQIKYVPS